jgi:hypothetical protein
VEQSLACATGLSRPIHLAILKVRVVEDGNSFGGHCPWCDCYVRAFEERERERGTNSSRGHPPCGPNYRPAHPTCPPSELLLEIRRQFRTQTALQRFNFDFPALLTRPLSSGPSSFLGLRAFSTVEGGADIVAHNNQFYGPYNNFSTLYSLRILISLSRQTTYREIMTAAQLHRLV